MEHFFNQYGDEFSAEEVVKDIDGNGAKLKKKEPKFYSITVSPSKYELNRLQNSSEDLKKYTRELMKDYLQSFNREINGRPVTIDDIKYYAKIEHQRTFKGLVYFLSLQIHYWKSKINYTIQCIVSIFMNKVSLIVYGGSNIRVPI